jgi:hypothetical protein
LQDTRHEGQRLRCTQPLRTCSHELKRLELIFCSTFIPSVGLGGKITYANVKIPAPRYGRVLQENLLQPSDTTLCRPLHCASGGLRGRTPPRRRVPNLRLIDCVTRCPVPNLASRRQRVGPSRSCYHFGCLATASSFSLLRSQR